MTHGITLVNAALRKAKAPIKLVRGRGYYYLVDVGEGTIAASLFASGLYWYRIEATAKDVRNALDEIVELLTDYRNCDDNSALAARITAVTHADDHDRHPRTNVRAKKGFKWVVNPDLRVTSADWIQVRK